MFSDKKELVSINRTPLNLKEISSEEVKDNELDKIKILELCNLIDKWEQEVLFSDNGYYSIIGNEIKSKLKEFIRELDDFVDSKISEMHFQDSYFKGIALKVKNDKLTAIKNEMLKYEQQQLKNWGYEVCENALSLIINRAVLYKTNQKIVSSSYKNGLDVLKLLSEKDKWDEKVLSYRKTKFLSDFFSALINSFFIDKDINAYTYFQKYKDFLQLEDRENIEKNIEQFRKNIIAYNWVKELSSYGLTEEEQQKEIKNIKDKEIEKNIKDFLCENCSNSERKKQVQEKERNIDNWNKIVELVKEDSNKAYLYIDYSLKKESVQKKKQYIKQMCELGYILTDKNQFLSLFEEFFKNPEEYKNKDISDYLSCFSNEDYELFLNIQKMRASETNKLVLDYKFISSKFEELQIEETERKYEFIKLFLHSKEEYKVINKKEADLDNRNKIIESISQRYKISKA